MSASGDGIGRASLAGVAWNAATFGLSKLVVLVTTIILARLLEPADFGLLGIGLVVIGYLDFVNDFGVSAAVIQHDGDPDHTADVAFWINLALGVTLAAVGFAVAPFVADFFDEPEATSVVRVLSLSFPITSLGAIHEARLRRELRFGSRVLPEFSKGVAKGAVSITLALLGFGVWSLVWGQLAGAFVAAVGYWIVSAWTPRLRFDGAVTRELLGFGSQMTLVGLLGGLHKNIDYLIVGRALGTRALGLYTMAFRLPQLLIESVVDVTGQVAFPAFARVRRDAARLRSGLRRMLGTVGLVITPLGIGLALTADPFVRIFYGDRWVDAIPVMQLLALYMLVQSLSKTCGDVYKAMGRPGILNRLAIVKLAITVPLLIIAAQDGIVAVAAAQLLSATILTLIRLVLAAHIVGTSFADVVSSFWPALRAGATMTVACLAAWLVVRDAGSFTALVTVTAVGVVTYAGTVWLFDRDQIRAIVSMARRPARPIDDATHTI